ncbi:MAG: adenylate/guanylate cyclase domain-containing protein [Desulfobacteraceae bacterium]|nr:adenylate/guanylate cyclase domain-containing protein [Desulfobacteraceae bacterium]
MLKSNEVESRIKEIRNAFTPSTLIGSSDQVLERLKEFEKAVGRYGVTPGLLAVIGWHRSLFLQAINSYSRSEELLDQALEEFEQNQEPFFIKWQLKACLSLGYNHFAMHNYLDAEFYLKEALKLSLTESDLVKFQGEIYALLAKVNLRLNRYNEALKYAEIEKENSYKIYKTNGTYGVIYANSLINYCYINRRIEADVHTAIQDLDKAISILGKMNNEKGLLKARLEKIEWQYLTNAYGKALDNALILEERFKENSMNMEHLRSGLLIAKVYKAMYDYDQAENKLDELLQLSYDFGCDREKIFADILYEKGTIYEVIDKDNEAFNYFRNSAKVSMTIGIKSDIIRAFNAARLINSSRAKELISSDLVYQDSQFVKNRKLQGRTPFSKTKNRVKLSASTLFVEIEGFGKLMEKTNDDRTISMVDEFIDRMSLIIYQNGGYIDKFLGEGFMAVFEHGSRLDSKIALNATRAAMDILRALKHKNRKLKKLYGSAGLINIRIGLSTGEIYAIVLGKYINREYLFLGNSLNLASTLQNLAIKSRVLIDTGTFNLVQSRVLAKKMTVEIRELEKRVDAYQIIRLARSDERPGENI